MSFAAGVVGVPLLLPHPAAPNARSVTAASVRRFIRVLLVSQYIECKRQRQDDRESKRAGIQVRHL
jgi:hypothetical protein